MATAAAAAPLQCSPADLPASGAVIPVTLSPKQAQPSLSPEDGIRPSSPGVKATTVSPKSKQHPPKADDGSADQPEDEPGLEVEEPLRVKKPELRMQELAGTKDATNTAHQEQQEQQQQKERYSLQHGRPAASGDLQNDERPVQNAQEGEAAQHPAAAVKEKPSLPPSGSKPLLSSGPMPASRLQTASLPGLSKG